MARASRAPRAPHAAGTAVLYVHGLWMMGAEALLLRERLQRERGYRLQVFRYGSVHQPMGEIVAALRDTIARLDAPRVHLLGHSFGGLVIHECLARYPMAQPGRAVFLGAPVLGSRAVRTVARSRVLRGLLGQAVRQELMGVHERRWESPRELGVIAGTLPLGFGRLVLKYDEPSDGTVAVSETRLPGATSHLILPVSHMGLLLSARAAREAGSFLEHGRFGL